MRQARPGKDCCGQSRHGVAGKERPVRERRGTARRGKVRQARRCVAGPVTDG